MVIVGRLPKSTNHPSRPKFLSSSTLSLQGETLNGSCETLGGLEGLSVEEIWVAEFMGVAG